jgi:hypothetical protein
MPGPGRNDGENDLARAYLAHQARTAARRLRHLDDRELRELFDDLFELPELDLALTITLPQLLTPDLQRPFDAVKADDPDAGDEVIPTILDQLDTPIERARLARVIIGLRDARTIDQPALPRSYRRLQAPPTCRAEAVNDDCIRREQQSGRGTRSRPTEQRARDRVALVRPLAKQRSRRRQD